MGIQDITNYSLECKNTDLFVTLEERLLDEFPEFKKYDVYYLVNTKRVKRYLTLDKIKLKKWFISIYIIEE